MVAPFVIVMGVTGSGKTTLGQRLAQRLGVEFFDADDYHTAANVEKMAKGVPLDDAARAPWLSALGELVENHRTGGVLACSALKQAYRDQLDEHGTLAWIYLTCTPELALERLSRRQAHFMPSSLIQSQFDALEEPRDVITIDSSSSTEEQLRRALIALRPT